MNLFISLTRTVVPALVSLVLATATWAGLDVDGEQVAMMVNTAVFIAYFSLFRLAESWAQRSGPHWLRTVAGTLLGWARPPEYPTPPDRLTRELGRVEGGQ